MLPETLQAFEDAVNLDAGVPESIVGGKLDRGEWTLEIAPERIVAACSWLKTQGRYERVSTVTGVDRYPSEPRFEIVYHLHSVSKNKRLRVKTRVHSVDPRIESVTPVWRAANWYEREVFDLFGVEFLNHPDLKRIMLPDDWTGHPLRKDYPITGSRV